MSRQRRQDWPSRLQRWASTQIGKAFVWGDTDCASLARAALIEMFGEEIAEYLPQWDSARAAVLILEERGSIGAVLEALGAVKTTVSFMRTGDFVVASEPDELVGRQSVMVCIDGQKCLASTRFGVVMSAPTIDSTVYSVWEVTCG